MADLKKNLPMISDFFNPSLGNFGCLLDHATCLTLKAKPGYFKIRC